MLSTLLTLFIVGMVASSSSAWRSHWSARSLGLAFTLLFKVAPILLVGYIVLRFLAPKPKQLSAEDRKWLES
jgi:hypothetical protein